MGVGGARAVVVGGWSDSVLAGLCVDWRMGTAAAGGRGLAGSVVALGIVVCLGTGGGARISACSKAFASCLGCGPCSANRTIAWSSTTRLTIKMGLRMPLSRVLWGHALGAKARVASLSAPIKRPGPEPHTPQLAELPWVCPACNAPPPAAWFCQRLGATGSAGSSSTKAAVQAAMPAMTNSRFANPATFTTGPSMYTASELMPKDTASRIPLTRERIESST